MSLTHWKKLHNPDYIGAYAIEPNTEPIVTIKSAGVESVTGASGKKEDCMVVHFVERWAKPLICNVTNSKTITKVTGSPYIEEWSGKKIQIYVASINAFGEEVEAIRIRPKAPKIEKPTLDSSHKQYDAIKAKLSANETTIEIVKQHFSVSEQVEEELLNA